MPTLRQAPVAIHVLAIDDDPSVRQMIADYLGDNEIKVTVSGSGKDIAQLLERETIDLVILDLKLPGEDGMLIARELRALSDIPIIMLTGRKDEADRVMGLELGADDYLTKPFSPQELVLRVGAILRRVAQAPQPSADVLRVGPLQIDRGAHRVAVDGHDIELTPTEYRLLVTLAERRGRVQARGHLLETVWEAAPDIQTRTVDMHVQRLRTKLGVAGDLIETVRGFGYRLRAAGQSRSA